MSQDSKWVYFVLIFCTEKVISIFISRNSRKHKLAFVYFVVGVEVWCGSTVDGRVIFRLQFESHQGHNA